MFLGLNGKTMEAPVAAPPVLLQDIHIPEINGGQASHVMAGKRKTAAKICGMTGIVGRVSPRLCKKGVRSTEYEGRWPLAAKACRFARARGRSVHRGCRTDQRP